MREARIAYFVFRIALSVSLSLAVMAGVAGAARLRLAALPELPRCYWIAPPISRYQPRLLHSGLLDCELAECRARLSPSPEAGWVCFFARPWG